MSVSLFAQTFNKGKPLVAIHGLLGNGDNLKLLSQLPYELHLLDLRNHGKSPHHKNNSISDMALDVLAYLDLNNLDDVFLLGHSLGGKVAMKIAALQPEIITKLIIEDIVPKQYLPLHDHIFSAMQAVEEKQPKTRVEVESILQEFIKEAPIRQFLQKNLTRTNNVLNWFVGWKNLQNSQLQWQKSPLKSNEVVNTPALFLQGNKSELMTVEDHALIWQHFPKAEVIVMEDAGHWVHFDNPTGFLVEVKHFLA